MRAADKPVRREGSSALGLHVQMKLFGCDSLIRLALILGYLRYLTGTLLASLL